MSVLNNIITNKRNLYWMMILLALAGLARVGWVVFKYSGQQSEMLSYPDEQVYCHLSDQLAAGNGLIDEFGYRATYMPVYPEYLFLFKKLSNPLFWARIIQAFLGALAAPITYLLARRWCEAVSIGNKHNNYINLIAILAGLAVALDPFLIFFSGLLLTETLFATLLAAAWVLVMPLINPSDAGNNRKSFWAGILLWLCIMLRPSAAILLVLVPLVIMICRRFERKAVYSSVLLVMVIVIGLLPWAVRNRIVIGQWCWLTTRGGISLYDGLHAEATGASDLANTKNMPEVAELTETQWDAYFKSQTWQAVQNDPLRAGRLAICKFLRTWSLRPNVGRYRTGAVALISLVWMSLILATAAVGFWIHRKYVKQWFILLLPVIGFTLLHMVFVGSVRYRVPVMPMMMVLSATGITIVINKLRLIISGEDKLTGH